MLLNRKHFQQLTKDRLDSLRLLEKKSMRGIRDSVVERYSERAHFVYELLQNADDVQATYVKFDLRKEGFYFIHNGKIPFTVTAPNSTPAGHINAITSIGASSKKDENYKIGKFGIGFKSVFQYTQTPHIFDPNVAFKIRDLIVPELLEDAPHPMRKKGETLFFFPFDKIDKPYKIAKKEIENRLESLQFPLLFLNHLTEIHWQTEEKNGFYKKEITQESDISKVSDSLTSHHLFSIKKFNNKITKTPLFQISKKEETTDLSYSIVFLLNEKGQINFQKTFPAHCFFPTRVLTNLKFLIHAPFLLTDSREGIRSEDDWNKNLIQLLAKLPFADLEILKKEELLNIAFFQAMAFEEKHFYGEQGRFFLPFFKACYQFLKTEDSAFLPTSKNQVTSSTQEKVSPHHFSSSKTAFIAESQSLRTLLNSNQLSNLLETKTANWIFPELPNHSTLGVFIRQVLTEQAQLENRQSPLLTWEIILKRMTPSFLEKQTDDWLLFLYEELLNHHRSLWNLAKEIPLIRLENGKHVLPFEKESGKSSAYLPSQLKSNYPTVKEEIAKQPKARLFLEYLGLTTPELREELEQFVLPKFRKETKELPTENDLEKLFLHYQTCNAEEAENLISELKKMPILLAANSDGEVVAAAPNSVYFYNEELTFYFQNYENVLWLDLEMLYENLLKNIDNQRFIKFLQKIGVADLPRFFITETALTEEEKKELMQQQTPGASYPMWEEIVDYELEGLEEFLGDSPPNPLKGEPAFSSIPEDKASTDSPFRGLGGNLPRSIFLWSLLHQIFDQKQVPTNGTYRYQYEETHEVEIEAFWLRLLKKEVWLCNVQRQFLSVDKLSLNNLNIDYQLFTNSEFAKILFKKEERNRLELLTEAERNALELGQKLLQKGMTSEDLQQFQQWQTVREKKKKRDEKRSKKERKKPEQRDTDEFNPAFLSSEELLEKQEALRQKLESELQEQIEELIKVEQLKNIIKESEIYSFAWFKALLELEYLLAFEQIDKDRSMRVEFAKVEREANTSKTILLKKPAKTLSPNIEMMGDITLKIQLPEERRTLEIEVVSIKDFSLRAKLKSPEQMIGIDFKTIRGATLEIQNTIFTLEELVKSFQALPFEDTDNLKSLLSENVRFLFGPPGTGKTTHLAHEEILPTMLGDENRKMLVLAPTNKSADVLVRKVMSYSTEPPKWLLRFGTSGDSIVENAGLLCDQTLAIEELDRYCLVTTATRFPYDGFGFGNPDFMLKNMDWDVILVDEASMISLAMITYILHQKPKTEIVIAGDPFQIEPIVFAEEWKGMNIYSMVNLDSFDPEIQQKNIEPHPFFIKNLITQYRAISTLGYVFSHFAYDGKLRHHRMPEERRPLKINQLPLKDVNIIRFPVQKLETLYRPQRLAGSHYHIYSALLTMEIVRHLVEQIFENHLKGKKEAKKWQIGIICPYKAQAQLVDKIIASQNIFRPKIRVSCGTIHSFQGDECDIMINLFNPPYSISKSPNMFLNRRNIINVAVSRAKDYLILLMPDNQTENLENLYQLNRLTSIIQYYNAGVCQQWHSYDIEENLFGQIDYLEQNSFATTHQSINVYTEPEKKFEIRIEDLAVDVQVKNE